MWRITEKCYVNSMRMTCEKNHLRGKKYLKIYKREYVSKSYDLTQDFHSSTKKSFDYTRLYNKLSYNKHFNYM